MNAPAFTGSLCRKIYLTLFLLGLIFCSTDSALAEVCDKFDENWKPGDPPLYFVPWTGAQILQNPFFIGLFLISIFIVWMRLGGLWGGIPVFLLAAIWVIIGWLFVILVIEDLNEPVTKGAIIEGCIGDSRNGVEPIFILFGISGLLVYLGFDIKRIRASQS
jgi:hypothetical protein